MSYSSEMCIGTNGKSAIAGMLATSHWRSVTVQTKITTNMTMYNHTYNIFSKTILHKITQKLKKRTKTKNVNWNNNQYLGRRINLSK